MSFYQYVGDSVCNTEQGQSSDNQQRRQNGQLKLVWYSEGAGYSGNVHIFVRLPQCLAMCGQSRLGS